MQVRLALPQDKLVTMCEDYKNENVQFYQSEETRIRYKAKIEDKKLFLYDAINKKYVLVENNTEHLYVLSKEKVLYVCDVRRLAIKEHLESTENFQKEDMQEVEKKKFHHSYFVAGEAVFLAGLIKVDHKSKVVMISNESGHYRPTLSQSMPGICFFHDELGAKTIFSNHEKAKDKIIENYMIDHLVSYYSLKDFIFKFDNKFNRDLNRNVRSIVDLKFSEKKLKKDEKSRFRISNKINANEKKIQNCDDNIIITNKKNKKSKHKSLDLLSSSYDKDCFDKEKSTSDDGQNSQSKTSSSYDNDCFDKKKSTSDDSSSYLKPEANRIRQNTRDRFFKEGDNKEEETNKVYKITMLYKKDDK